MRGIVLGMIAVAICGCSGSARVAAGSDGRAVPQALAQDVAGSGGERCNAGVAGRESSEYDTSGDEHPDIRKVFMRVGSGVNARLVMICRESDLNGDGRKDVIRYYDDEGRSLREEADRNFDGRMDLSIIYQDGNIVRKESDENNDGKVDLKVYFDEGKAVRAEKDLAGRSSATQWRPDRWEYFEEGRMVRMGTDLDGDSRVDRWDRDQQWKRAQEAEREAAAKETAEEAANQAEGEGGEESDEG